MGYGRSACVTISSEPSFEKGVRRVEEWVRHSEMARAEWPSAPSDPFLNINTPEDLANAQGLVEPAAMRR